MAGTIDPGTVPCRPVTADEVEHFHEFGWAKLRGFVDPVVIAKLLDIARGKMGDDADSNGGRVKPQGDLSYFNAE